MQFDANGFDMGGELPVSRGSTALNGFGIGSRRGAVTRRSILAVTRSVKARGTTAASVAATRAVTKGIATAFANIGIASSSLGKTSTAAAIVRRRTTTTTIVIVIAHRIDAGPHGIFHGSRVPNARGFVVPTSVTISRQDSNTVVQSILGIKVEARSGIVGPFPRFDIGVERTAVRAQFQHGLIIAISSAATPTFGKGSSRSALYRGSAVAVHGAIRPVFLASGIPAIITIVAISSVPIVSTKACIVVPRGRS
mmetsp:Transcript_18045/g.49139  ORF Transcript_18045/g.49139 Transcript_18045/m.49139 type:complete len:253 (+) Transcript_18045:331-1089(+)